MKAAPIGAASAADNSRLTTAATAAMKAAPIGAARRAPMRR